MAHTYRMRVVASVEGKLDRVRFVHERVNVGKLLLGAGRALEQQAHNHRRDHGTVNLVIRTTISAHSVGIEWKSYNEI